MTVVAKFEVEFIQFLDKDGHPTQPLPKFAEDINTLIAMYRTMQIARIMDSKAVNLQRMGKMGTYPSSLGQEAVGVGLGYAMRKDDVFVPYYRDQGAMIVRGVTVTEILNYWGGDERASNYKSEIAKEDFPIAIPVGSQCLHAAGVAFAMHYHKQKRAVVCGCGEGGTSKGDFYEAMNFAGVYNSPVVFLVNNNQWAISVPRSLQTHAKTIAQKAIAAGIEGIQVDGNDVIAVREVVEKSLHKAREGKGPTLIEAVTYRLCDHTTADHAKRYWDEAEVKTAGGLEPITRLKKYLIAQNAWSEEQDKKLIEECTAEVDKAVADYLAIKPAAKTDMFDYLYATLPEELIEQREQLT